MSRWIRKHNGPQRHTGGPTKLVKKNHLPLEESWKTVIWVERWPTLADLERFDLFGIVWKVARANVIAPRRKRNTREKVNFISGHLRFNFRQIKKHKAREYERWFEAEKPWLGSLGVREWVVLPRMTWTFLNLIAARKIQTNWSGVEVWPICKTQTTKALWIFPMNKNEFKWITRNRNRQIMQMKRQPSIHILSKIFDQGEILPTDFDNCTIQGSELSIWPARVFAWLETKASGLGNLTIFDLAVWFLKRETALLSQLITPPDWESAAGRYLCTCAQYQINNHIIQGTCAHVHNSKSNNHII